MQSFHIVELLETPPAPLATPCVDMSERTDPKGESENVFDSRQRPSLSSQSQSYHVIEGSIQYFHGLVMKQSRTFLKEKIRGIIV
jgi:hypothetical protein